METNSVGNFKRIAGACRIKTNIARNPGRAAELLPFVQRMMKKEKLKLEKEKETK